MSIAQQLTGCSDSCAFLILNQYEPIDVITDVNVLSWGHLRDVDSWGTGTLDPQRCVWLCHKHKNHQQYGCGSM